MAIILQEYGKVIWQKRGYFLLALFALATATILAIYTPVFYKNIANGLAAPYTDATRSVLLHNLFRVAWFYAGIWLSWRLLEIAIIPLDGGGVNLLEKRCFEILQRQNHGFFEDSYAGSLIKQAHRFAHSFEIIMDWFLFQFFQNILAIIMAFIIFYRQQPLFAWYFLIWVVVFVAWNAGYSIWKLRFDKAVAECDSKVGGTYSDAISNIFVVKAFALESTEQQRVNQASDAVYRKKKRAWILMFISFAVQGLMTFFIELFLVYLMIQKWQFDHFQVGEFVLFQSILLMLIQHLWEFGRNFRTFFTALADAAEMTEIISRVDIETDTIGAQAHRIEKGEICFAHVHFSYPASASSNKLFKDFSLTIEAGEKIALVGQSGSGKSTLTKLLFRFLTPQTGCIYFDGIDIRNITLSSLREQISLVPQQPELFHRSIGENITLGKNISQQQLLNVARKSHCFDFINDLPEQFDTRVGERGIKLSGGEKQRVALARAFLEDAPIIILDEATSALDSLTESLIQKAIFELIAEKTAIVIAHRLSTVLRMDKILVLHKGRIIEQGNHAELLSKRGQYYRMWQHQSGGFFNS